MFLNRPITDDDVPRSLDLTALRSFVAVADTGGVTRASGFLHLTQSAVSMQVKRLEDALACVFFSAPGAGVALTPAGEQLLGYARRMVSLNDEALSRLTHRDFEGEIGLGVPHDIVYPAIPQVLKRFAADWPRMRVRLVSGCTLTLREMHAAGDLDLYLSTEDGVEAGGRTLTRRPLVWIGAHGGAAWRGRPLPLAFEESCIFRPGVQGALDAAGIPWEMAVTSESTRTVEATVAADLAVHVAIEGNEVRAVERIDHGGALPPLASQRINLYGEKLLSGEPALALACLVREAFGARPRRAPEPSDHAAAAEA